MFIGDKAETCAAKKVAKASLVYGSRTAPGFQEFISGNLKWAKIGLIKRFICEPSIIIKEMVDVILEHNTAVIDFHLSQRIAALVNFKVKSGATPTGKLITPIFIPVPSKVAHLMAFTQCFRFRSDYKIDLNKWLTSEP
jgi:hypothetical protein